MSLQQCSINLFGDLRVEAMGVAVTQFRTRKIAALLGVLAYHTDRTFRRDELIEMIWPDSNPESGRNRLRIALCGLRQDLDGVRADDNLLVSDRLHVTLNANGFRTDKEEFESCLRRADSMTDPDERYGLLNRALSLYAGELLPGHEETWILGEREKLRHAYLRALRDMVRNRAETGRTAEALAYAERWAQLDALNEEAHRIVMRVLVALNRPGDALQQYARMERLLQEQLGIGPSAHARALADECRRNNPVSAQPSALLAELATPEPARQDAPASPAPAITVAVTPEQPTSASPPSAHYAPELTFPLFGRDEAIQAVIALLTGPDTRLVTLTGPGGIGKTCLALAVAAQVRDRFADGVCFVPLAELANAALIPESVATALGLRDTEPETCLAKIAAYAAGRSLALLLDNFEHLADVGAPVVQALLSHAPGIRTLITSRQRLRLIGEAEFAVPPLPVPDDAASLEGLAAYASVQMFLDRARRIRAGFRLDADNAADIAAICRALDGMPLGIELVASWTQLLTPAQIRARFQDRFIDVTSRSRATPDRHQSLRRVVETSCELLSAEATQLFATLSVFRGTFTLAAVEAVAAPTPGLYEILAELMDQSLLAWHEGGHEYRFSLLEPLREYAATQLTAKAYDEAARRHADYYWQLAEAADTRLRGPETAQGLQTLDAESPNIRVALERFVTDPGLGVPLAGALRRYWLLRGRYREGLEWLERALAGGDTGPPELRARALRGAGNLALRLFDFAVAGTWFREALALDTARRDWQSVASTLNSLASVADGQGERAQAQALYEESLQRYRDLDDRRGIALTLSNLAALHANSGGLDVAFALHTQAIALFRELGAVDSLIIALGNLANVECRRGHLEEARAALHESLPLVRQLGNRVDLADWLEHSALLAICRGEMSRAALLWGRSQAQFRELQLVRVGDDIFVKSDDVDRMRAALGEPAFDEAVQRGGAMTDDEAVELALPNPPSGP